MNNKNIIYNNLHMENFGKNVSLFIINNISKYKNKIIIFLLAK
ncbi:hypothetical protein NARSGI1_01960 [endosymbiont of Sipalinus gigas]|nr:hypothetical protein [endosymbiont of Sipalinus gigas]BBA85333.1 hypothetical protein NARSGI1_01960 [endosymbiont of Sipalinus gigas]